MLHPSVDARDSSGEMICAKPGVPQFACPLRESGLFTPQPAAHDLKNHVSTITRNAHTSIQREEGHHLRQCYSLCIHDRETFDADIERI